MFDDNNIVKWSVRVLQLLAPLTSGALACYVATSWRQIDCTLPWELSFNIAVAVLSLLYTSYLCFTKTLCPSSRLGKLPAPGLRLTIFLDAIFTLFWVICAATAVHTASAVCSACNAGPGQQYDSGYGYCIYTSSRIYMCAAFTDDDLVGRTCPATPFSDYDDSLLRRATKLGTISKIVEDGASIAAKKGLNIALTFFFLGTLFWNIYLVLQNPTSGPVSQEGELNQMNQYVGVAQNLVDPNDGNIDNAGPTRYP